MNSAELKAVAKEQIRGKIGMLFLVSLIIAAIAAAVSFVIPLVGPIVSLIIVTPAFTISIIRVYLNIAAGGDVEAGDAFSGFDDFWSAFKVQFLVGLFTFLWSLLLYIPGIIKSYSYSMSMYILAENKGKPALECIRESMAMTEGHKFELFILGLSFIGWGLLCGITCGIAGIWVIPYMQTTYANAYNYLKPVKPAAAIEDTIWQA